MKKYIGLPLFAIFSVSAFACIGDSVDIKETNQFYIILQSLFSDIISTFSLSVFIGSCLSSFMLISYGLMLLAKKYAPQHHPIVSWIPLYNFYVFMILNGRSLLWLLVILICFFVPFGGLALLCVFFYFNYHLAKKLNRNYGAAICLTLFPVIAFPILGSKEQGKPIVMVSILGGLVTILTIAMIILLPVFKVTTFCV